MTKKKPGRKTLLNADLQREICYLLSEGVPVGATCDTVGITQATYHAWIAKGEEGRAPYREFVEDTTRARGQARVLLLKKISLIKRLARTRMAAIALLAGGIFREPHLATSPTRAVTPNQLRPRRSRCARTRRSDCQATGELATGAEDRPAPRSTAKRRARPQSEGTGSDYHPS